jgi:uncharacterized repeat protein (TIGR01451 family)
MALLMPLLVAGSPVRASVSVPQHTPAASAPAAFVDGENSDCAAWKIVFLDLGFFDLGVEIAEEGWVWTNGEDTTDKFRDASGVVTKSKVAHNDTPANHFSHDWNVDIRVDPGQEGLLSNVNSPNNTDAILTDAGLLPADKIEMEWETGVTPGEKTGDGANPFLPRWVLPNFGDRVWTNGHWVFDCGHAKKIGGELVDTPGGGQAIVGGVDHFRTEIHPGRAIASMRSQAGTIPGSGTTPVPVTATDLFIHGQGAFMVQQLECGIDRILGEGPCPITTTPIDELYGFDVCLPPRPDERAALSWSDVAGPGNDGFGPVPTITDVPANEACQLPVDEFGNDFDNSMMLHVEVDLRGSGIAAGWVHPPATPLPHLSLELDLLDLHADHEGLNFDGEFTFWWMSVDPAPADEWHRLVNHEIPTDDDSGPLCFQHTNHLNDMDDDGTCGNGELRFSGPTWDFYLRGDRAINIRTTGFEQDCYDDHFGSGEFSLLTYIDCHFGNFLTETANDWGNNDALPPLEASISGLGEHRVGISGEFHFEFTLSQIPAGDEDEADLGVSKTCTWDGEVALAGEPISCTIVVTNAGPGLPRDVVVDDVLTTSLPTTDYTVGAATFHVGTDPTALPCGPSSASGFSCAIGTVPVGGSVTIEVEITPHKAGSIANGVTVSSPSSDDDATDDEAGVDVDIFQPVQLEIRPSEINLKSNGVIPITLRTADGFHPTLQGIATACFGDAETPAERSCSEAHGMVPFPPSDSGHDVDLVLHYRTQATGIDPGDTSACIKGTTSAGTGFFGCAPITTK